MARRTSRSPSWSGSSNPHFFGLIRGASRQAAAADVSMVLGEAENEAETEKTLIRRLRSSVDGFVLGASRMTNDDLRDVFDRELTGVPSVIIEHDT